MRKSSLVKSALAIIALCGIASSSALLVRSTTNEKGANAAESTSFAITTESAMNDNVIVLNVDTALPEKSAETSIKWYLNGTEYVSWVQPFAKGDTEITLTFGDAGNASAKKLTNYAHYFIPSGTDFGAGCTLNDDYSFWWAHHSGGNATMAWSFQHGGAGAIWNHEIPSIHIAGLNANSGAQDDNERFVVNFDITKEAGVYSEASWNAASVMMATGSGEYSLYDYAPGKYIVNGNDQIMAKSNKDATSGTWGLLIYYAPLGIASGNNTARSFWIPKDTLYGGFNENYGFYVDNDVYFDWTGSSFVGTFDTSMKTRVYDPIDNLVSKLHMDSTIENQCVTYWSEAQSAYNALSDEAKGIFASQTAYTAANQRYAAWSKANGGGSGSSLFQSSKDYNEGNAILICAFSCGILIASAVLIIRLRKKKHD